LPRLIAADRGAALLALLNHFDQMIHRCDPVNGNVIDLNPELLLDHDDQVEEIEPIDSEILCEFRLPDNALTVTPKRFAIRSRTIERRSAPARSHAGPLPRDIIPQLPDLPGKKPPPAPSRATAPPASYQAARVRIEQPTRECTLPHRYRDPGPIGPLALLATSWLPR
jgi:hypothetical protein